MTGADPTTVHFSSVGGVQITAYRWDPEGEPAGIAQLTHGMGEHALRYGPLAEALNARGLVVYGQDHRGHGATGRAGGGYGVLGENGWGELVNDIGRLTDHIRGEYPDLPLVLIGHSMGSFAIQQYLIDHSDRVNAAALTGTAAIDLLAPVMNLDEPIDLSLFNTAFAPARTNFDWLKAGTRNRSTGTSRTPAAASASIRRPASRCSNARSHSPNPPKCPGFTRTYRSTSRSATRTRSTAD